MIEKFEDITIIDNKNLFDEISGYEENLIQEATVNGALKEQGADNEYTREIARIGSMLADYESAYMEFENLNFKSPLILGIENELSRRSLKQREAAELLHVKESTFSQIIRGKRPISMQMAKRLYKVFDIDPKLILEHS